MTIRFQYKIAFVLALAGFQAATAQKKDENIGTEVVNVVKPYTPTISDAFKVKETPVMEDEDNAQKKEIEYNIFSFPVASTFTPAKGKAAGVKRGKKETAFNNYASLGIGNYGTINAELFVTENLNRNEYVGGMLRHISSQGGIDGVVLDDKYYNTSLDLTYGNRQKDYSWNADMGYQNQVYNWYGLPLEYVDFTDEQIAAIDPKQTYNTFYLGGNIAAEDSFFRDASVLYKRFWDGYGSAENRFYVKPSLDVDVLEEKIKVDFIADYVGGTFEQGPWVVGEELTYSHLNFGVQPSILFQRDDLSVQLGAGLFYSSGKIDDENDGKFFVYPQIKASYKVVGDLMIAYAGAEGSLKQNSYADFVSQNPFVSPDLLVTPTNQQYDIYVGLKGKLANTVAYNIRGSYMNEDDKAFFRNSLYIPSSEDQLDNYHYNNSFGVVYNRLRTISFFGELKADISNNVSFGVNGTFNSYDTDMKEAWNLPSIRIGADLDVDITEKWYAGANVFFVGERKDLIYPELSFDQNIDSQTVTLDSYFDANAHVGYRYNERLTGFLKLNNIAGQNYQKWVNYPVQGFQFLLGASYKFNF
ncbi:TonB-dependent receptor [Flavobacterium alkalisoli]|uniref:TonB-dependent receptor n=1 Tax=Flavobacterium alkalisoli TaxID=2602769 RepID=A0A5B9FVS1_9FLAO|nr:TonB-dependent receptor [Flavobacterium alkalisoli]QEE51283.1 TonB-dependent receptor [Flavobacterium alkalisoli]